MCVPNHLGQRSAAADANRGDVKNYENEGDDEMRADFFSRLEKNIFFSLDMVSFSDVSDHSSEIRGLRSTKCSSETLHICYTLCIRKPM